MEPIIQSPLNTPYAMMNIAILLPKLVATAIRSGIDLHLPTPATEIKLAIIIDNSITKSMFFNGINVIIGLYPSLLVYEFSSIDCL